MSPLIIELPPAFGSIKVFSHLLEHFFSFFCREGLTSVVPLEGTPAINHSINTSPAGHQFSSHRCPTPFLGYFDRVKKKIITVAFQEVDFPKDDPRAFVLKDEEGRCHRVPLHRVREVYKNGRRIWQRPQRVDE